MRVTQDKKIGLIMLGGGARAAFQIGVLKAVATLLPGSAPNPFQIISGTSAGAINATTLAIYARNFNHAVRRLERVWSNFTVGQVYRADARGIALTGAHWLAALMLGGLGRRNPTALLDRTPLRHLLERYLPCDKIQQSVDEGLLHALCLTASGYYTGQSVSFFQGVPGVEPWQRSRRVGIPTRITVDHLMASSAIPFMFEAVKIQREYFGDGTMRQVSPLSSAIHLGAEKLFVIGVRKEDSGPPLRMSEPPGYPGLAQVAGHVLASIFLDSLEADLERLKRINETVRRFPENGLGGEGAHLRVIEPLVISPSAEMREIAERHKRSFPAGMRFLLRGIGAYRQGGADIVSYLLFDRHYCAELIELGYSDAMQRKDDIQAFFSHP